MVRRASARARDRSRDVSSSSGIAKVPSSTREGVRPTVAYCGGGSCASRTVSPHSPRAGASRLAPGRCGCGQSLQRRSRSQARQRRRCGCVQPRRRRQQPHWLPTRERRTPVHRRRCCRSGAAARSHLREREREREIYIERWQMASARCGAALRSESQAANRPEIRDSRRSILHTWRRMQPASSDDRPRRHPTLEQAREGGDGVLEPIATGDGQHAQRLARRASLSGRESNVRLSVSTRLHDWQGGGFATARGLEPRAHIQASLACQC